MTLKHDAWLPPCRGLVALLAIACLAFVGCSKKTPQELLDVATSMMQARDWFGAEMQYQKILDQYPQASEAIKARAGLLTCYRMTNDYDSAFAQFDLLIKDVGGIASPRGFNALLSKLTLYVQVKQFDKGLTCALEADKSLGGKLPIMQHLQLESYIGRFYVVAKQKAKAQDLAKRMIEETAKQPSLQHYAIAMMSITHDQPTDRDALLGIFQDFLKRFPTSPIAPDVRFSVSQLFDSMGKKAEAKQAYDQAIVEVKTAIDKALGTEKIDLTMKMAGILQLHGDKASFRATLNGIIEHYPTSQQAAQALLALADQDFREDGKPRDALAKLGRVLNGPTFPDEQNTAMRWAQDINQALTSSTALQAVRPTSGTLRNASPSVATTLTTPTKATTLTTPTRAKQAPAPVGAAAR
jgi:TolA-binding protein